MMFEVVVDDIRGSCERGGHDINAFRADLSPQSPENATRPSTSHINLDQGSKCN